MIESKVGVLRFSLMAFLGETPRVADSSGVSASFIVRSSIKAAVIESRSVSYSPSRTAYSGLLVSYRTLVIFLGVEFETRTRGLGWVSCKNDA